MKNAREGEFYASLLCSCAWMHVCYERCCIPWERGVRALSGQPSYGEGDCGCTNVLSLGIMEGGIGFTCLHLELELCHAGL